LRGTLLDEAADQGTKRAKGLLGCWFLKGGAKLPVLKKAAHPYGIVEAFGGIAKAVEQAAIDEIDPRGMAAKATINKRVWSRGHCVMR
jgi:hypothetical protein